MTKLVFLLAVVLASTTLAAGPDPILLWPAGAPNAKGDAEHDQPTLRVTIDDVTQLDGNDYHVDVKSGTNKMVIALR